VELSSVARPPSCLQLPAASLPPPEAAHLAAATDGVAHSRGRAAADWLLPAPDSAAGSITQASRRDEASESKDVGCIAGSRGVNGDAALRGAQLAATRRELDAARDKILRLLQQVVATQAARDEALQQANQQVTLACQSTMSCARRSVGRRVDDSLLDNHSTHSLSRHYSVPIKP
jgi:hypothetical protein